MRLLAGVLACVFVAASGRADPPEEIAPCSSWLSMELRNQIYLVSSDVSNRVGSPDQSELAACMWSKLEAVAREATRVCEGGEESYEAAVTQAVLTIEAACADE